MNELQKVEQAQPVANTEIKQNVSSPMRLVEMAISQNADIDKLEKLMDMQERWDAKQAEKSFNDAMSKFQAECPVIKSHKSGGSFKGGGGYMYAPIGDIVEQVRDTMAKHGLSYRFEQAQNGAEITVTCVATHVDGHSVRLSISGNPDASGSKNSVQSVGSTITYLRRYTLTGVFGIVTGDADTDARVGASQVVKGASVKQAQQIVDLCSELGIEEQKFMQVVSSRLNFAGVITSYMQLTDEQADFAISMLKDKMERPQ